MRLPVQTPPDHAPPQHHLPLRFAKTKATAARCGNISEYAANPTANATAPHGPDRQGVPNRVGIENKPAIVDRNHVTAIGKPTYHCRQRTEKRSIDLGRKSQAATTPSSAKWIAAKPKTSSPAAAARAIKSNIKTGCTPLPWITAKSSTNTPK